MSSNYFQSQGKRSASTTELQGRIDLIAVNKITKPGGGDIVWWTWDDISVCLPKSVFFHESSNRIVAKNPVIFPVKL